MYLRHSLKDGTAKGVVEGLSQSGDCYSEAIESLKACYDRLRLIHQTHVHMNLEATPLRDGTGKEFRQLYDVIHQHLQALKAMEYQPSGSVITSVLELIPCLSGKSTVKTRSMCLTTKGSLSYVPKVIQ